MYKVASRNLQRSHHVNRPLPTGGFVGLSAPVDHDFIPSADNLSREDCEAERRQLLLEKVRAENQLIASKQAGDTRAITGLGHRLQGYSLRLAANNKRMRTLNESRECELMSSAIKELCSPELQQAIWAMVSEGRNNGK
jgi:hypothetical protein